MAGFPPGAFDGPEFDAAVNAVLQQAGAPAAPATPPPTPTPPAPDAEPSPSATGTDPGASAPAAPAGNEPPAAIPYPRFQEVVEQRNALRPAEPYLEGIQTLQALGIDPAAFNAQVQMLAQGGVPAAAPVPAPASPVPPAGPAAPAALPTFEEWLAQDLKQYNLTPEDLAPNEVWQARTRFEIVQAQEQQRQAQQLQAQAIQQAAAERQRAEQERQDQAEFTATLEQFPEFKSPALQQALIGMWERSPTLTFAQCAAQIRSEAGLTSRNAAVDAAAAGANPHNPQAAADAARPNMTGGAPPPVAAPQFDFKNASEEEFEAYARQRFETLQAAARQ